MKATIRKPDGTVIEIDGTADEIRELIAGGGKTEPVYVPVIVSPPSETTGDRTYPADRLVLPLSPPWQTEPVSPFWSPTCICGQPILQVGPIFCPQHGYLGTAGETICMAVQEGAFQHVAVDALQV